MIGAVKEIIARMAAVISIVLLVEAVQLILLKATVLVEAQYGRLFFTQLSLFGTV